MQTSNNTPADDSANGPGPLPRDFQTHQLPSDDLVKGYSYFRLEKLAAYAVDLRRCGAVAKLLPKCVSVVWHFEAERFAYIFQAPKRYFADYLYDGDKLTDKSRDLLELFVSGKFEETPQAYLYCDSSSSENPKATALKRAKRYARAYGSFREVFSAEKEYKIALPSEYLPPHEYTTNEADWLVIDNLGLQLKNSSDYSDFIEDRLIAKPWAKVR